MEKNLREIYDKRYKDSGFENEVNNNRKRLKEICTNEKIAGVLKTYPWYKLPVKQAAFAFAMKYKLFLLQKIMVLLRDR